jgi:uncharacterized protein (DUF849 family)
MRKVWIEAALNGAWGCTLQPGIPDTIDAIVSEGVACAKAGAAIVHMHAYDGGGPQTFAWQVYARIIEGIRNQVESSSIRHIRRGPPPKRMRARPVDAPLGSKTTNLAWVEDAVRLVRQHGGDIASSADVRRALQAAA